MSKFGAKGTLLVSAIGDRTTVTGLLLTGMGERNLKNQTNFLIVDKDTDDETIETTKMNIKISNFIMVSRNSNCILVKTKEHSHYVLFIQSINTICDTS